jgi:glycosyltransferase involved in cell wall biosynthesis
MKSELERFFDEKYYALSSEARKMRMRPFDHYVEIGEALGYAPSAQFDPKHYAQAYDDVVSFAGGMLSHYVRFGKAEGRLPIPGPSDVVLPFRKLDNALPTILIVVHEASRTGAPILAWNLITSLRPSFNVVTLLLEGGPIEAALEEASSDLIKLPSDRTKDVTSQFLCKVVEAFGPRFAIANSVATRDVAIGLEEINVPVIALVHEFSSDFQPIGTLHGLFLEASKVVFPAHIVASASLRDYVVLRTREYVTLPQGRAKLPKPSVSSEDGNFRCSLENLESIARDEFLVVGMGTVTYRKGVDVFISVAASLSRMFPRGKWKFLWVGHVYPFDAKYKAYLRQQISNSGLDGRVLLMDEVADLDPIYRRADSLLLSSRLDPLPNVAIEAALRGLPIVSFEGASGIAEFLVSDQKTRGLVVPYLDACGAARAILRLSKDGKHRKAMSRSIQSNAKRTFRMSRYVATLKKLGKVCVAEQEQAMRDLQIILKAGVFDAKFCFGPDEKERPLAQSIWRYLKQSRVARPLDRARTGLFFRRPMVGFNPLIYASDHPEMRSSIEDPLAHFLRSGRPAGRWTHQVIVPRKRVHQGRSAEMRVALHGHFHYPDLLNEFLDRVSLNKTRVDLVLTTTGRDKANEIAKILKMSGIRNARIHVVKNRGRDIGPFLELFGRLGNAYDVIGHIHGKKSAHVATVTGDRWREFALQHLLGGTYPMADTIIEQFANDPTLGLVFPEDPHLNDWDENRVIADGLAKRMKIGTRLPTHFDFPIGTMFWARPGALKPMFSLNLTAEDYPAEPVPIDGTILHALERLLPFSAAKAGYRYATSHVPGSLR